MWLGPGTRVLDLLIRGLDPAESIFRSPPSFALFCPTLLPLRGSVGPLPSNSSSVDDAELDVVGRDRMTLARGDRDRGMVLAWNDDGFGKYVKGDVGVEGD